jgi:hypothetical protein
MINKLFTYIRKIKGREMEAKFPNVIVTLVGQNGNAYNLLGLCRRAFKKYYKENPCDFDIDEKLKEFEDEAMSGDYDHLLCTCMKWFNVK